MSRDKRNTSTIPYNLASQIRGLYGRVARQLKVDPSYVSRVARGERQSAEIETSLERELRRIMGQMKSTRVGRKRTSAMNHDGAGRDGHKRASAMNHDGAGRDGHKRASAMNHDGAGRNGHKRKAMKAKTTKKVRITPRQVSERPQMIQ